MVFVSFQTINLKIITLFFKKNIENFEIVHKTC